jgi:small-conductance mechanosensitive channel
MAVDDVILTFDEPSISVKEKVGPTVTASEVRSIHGHVPALRRQLSATESETSTDDQLTKFGRKFFELLENPVIRYSIYVFPIAAVLAIPLILFATKYSESRADGIRLLGLFVWIEILWASLWISKLIAAAIPYIFQGLCGLISTGVRKYALILRALEIPISLFIWTIIALVSAPTIHHFDRAYYAASFVKPNDRIQWIQILYKVIKASIGSAALWLALKLLMQLIAVSYHGKQYKEKIRDIKRTTMAVDLLYQASLRLYPDHHPNFLAEDYDIHDTTNVQKLLKQYSADRTTLRIFGDVHYFGERLVSAFGRMASDISGAQVFRPTAAHAVVEAALERRAGAEAMARRIYRSLVQPNQHAISEADITTALGPDSSAEAAFIFAQLDRDGNGDVELSEMVLLFTSISKLRKDVWRSAVDIKYAIKTLDSVLSLIVLLIISIIYSSFFSNFIADNWKGILGILSAGAFSFGQTVGEFNAACILVFVKHPFDVGDRVNMNGHQYIVKHISLLYTVFLDIESNAIAQVANSVVGNLWTDNLSRSRAQKERFTFSVSVATSMTEIGLLRHELEKFVADPENSRDFMPDVEIELVSVGDLKQLDLRVEIKHKSNFANESLRAYRRNKFMCALLSAMRKVPIHSPAGNGPAQGSIHAPNYAVTVSEEEVREAVAVREAGIEAQKLVAVDVESGVSPGAVAVSSGLEVLLRPRPGDLGENNPFRRLSSA